MPLFPDDVIVYVDNNLSKKILELISEFSKVSGCKIISAIFLYTNSEHEETEI